MIPNMSSVLNGWTQDTQFAVTKNENQDFDGVDKRVAILHFQGNIQPLPQQRLAMKPEGERAWRWWTLRTTQRLEVGWVFQDQSPDGKQYRAVARADWSAAGFYEYEAVEQPKEAGTR